MPKKLDLTDDKYGILTVLSEAHGIEQTTKQKQYFWNCQCECGNTIIVPSRYLRERKHIIKSCGCLFKIANNMSQTRQYRIWFGMKDRCTRENNTRYEYYGARGISYDPKWEAFNDFWEDMKQGYKDTLSLDRIDNDKDYSKENCRWVNQTKQVRNRGNTRTITYKGETKPLAVWAQEYGFTYTCLYDRVVTRGWNLDRAFNQVFGDRRRLANK